jgi:hypothetical protein
MYHAQWEGQSEEESPSFFDTISDPREGPLLREMTEDPAECEPLREDAFSSRKHDLP